VTESQQSREAARTDAPALWWPDARPIPQAFLDAGDLPWPKLAPVLRRALENLVSGDLLELATGDPETMQIVPVWCDGANFTLIHREAADRSITFWIGKQ
jgi:TusA-related sulfurtransferase